MKHPRLILITCLYLLITTVLQAQQESPFVLFMGTDCHLGLADQDKKEILAAKYANILVEAIGNDWLIKAQHKSQVSYFLSQNNQLIPLNYPDVQKLNDRLLRIGHHGEFGMVNTAGQGVLLMYYDDILPAGPTAAIVNYRGGYGVVDLEGKEQIPFQYKEVKYWEIGGFWALENGHYQLFGTTGKILEGANYEAIEIPQTALPICGVAKEGKWGLINTQNEFLLETKYTDITLFDLGIVAAQNKESQWELFDIKGEKLLKDAFDEVYELENGTLVIGKKGKKGLLDKDMKVLLPQKYNTIRSIGRNWVAVSEGNGEQIYDSQAKRFLEPRFEAIKSGEGWTGILFQQEKKWGWLSYDNQVLIQPSFANATPQGAHAIIIEGENRKLGSLNIEGGLVLPTEYTIIIPKNQFFKVKKEGTGWYYVDGNNKKIDCQGF